MTSGPKMKYLEYKLASYGPQAKSHVPPVFVIVFVNTVMPIHLCTVHNCFCKADLSSCNRDCMANKV